MNIEHMFSTPLAWKYMDDIDNDLIMDHCHKTLNDNPSGDLDFNSYPIKTLTDKVTECVNYVHKQCGLKYSQKVFHSWCNYSNLNKNICKPHTHPRAFFVAIYYLTDSDVKLCFQNPLSSIENLVKSEIVDTYNPFNQFEKFIPPQKGLLLIHPAWVVHYVDSVQDDRMSIAYNFVVDDQVD